MNFAGTPHVTSFGVPEHAIDTKAVIAVSMIVRYFFMSSKNYCSGFKGP